MAEDVSFEPANNGGADWAIWRDDDWHRDWNGHNVHRADFFPETQKAEIVFAQNKEDTSRNNADLNRERAAAINEAWQANRDFNEAGRRYAEEDYGGALAYFI
jgi:hypothetical protein